MNSEPALYFASDNCGKCTSYFMWLKSLEQEDPRILFYKIDPYSSSGRERYQLKWNSLENPRGEDYYKFPALFIGDTLLTGTLRNDSLIFHHFYFRERQEESAVFQTGPDMTLIAVGFLGLVDGINPCAFTALIFLISLMTISGREKKTVILSSVFYIIGIFSFYLVFGWAAASFLSKNFQLFPGVALFVKIAIVLFCVVAAAAQVVDSMKPSSKLSSLSDNTVRRIHGILRKWRGGFFMLFFISGFVVSFSELLCTGQIYIPTLIVMTSKNLGMLPMLLAYNIMFVLPLWAVLIVYISITDISPFQKIVGKNLKIMKIFLAIIIFTLGMIVLIGTSL
ncbi:hypothetical protein JXA84_06155 [candidate division WOR-3 bacterium]|nr:hypothetical protein [candidate division WOR-3 bacterium]